MPIKSINWRSYFSELTIVTLGILIAFWLNSWSENRKEEKLAALYLKGIYEEISANREAVSQAHAHHQRLLQELRKNPSKANLILSPANISRAAWQLAENTVFKKHIDQKLYGQLSSLYQSQSCIDEVALQASSLMGESNVLGAYYTLPLMEKDFSEEDLAIIHAHINQGWIPIFETWVSCEEEYLGKAKALTGNLNTGEKR